MNSNDTGGELPTDDGPVIVETNYEDRSPSIAVVAALAALEDTPTIEVDFVLHEHIDPDAMDMLMAAEAAGDDEEQGDVTAEFSIGEYTVLVRNDGTLKITTHDDAE